MKIGFVAAAMALASIASAQSLPVYSTWDSDLIDSEAGDVATTGRGVYVAVLDTGLVPYWREYFPDARVAIELGTGFHQPVSFKAQKDQCGLGVEVGRLSQTTWVGSRGSTHGTHVASTIIGYNYRSNSDLAGGFPLPPIYVRGIAPDVTIIPVKVLADYNIPALPKCTDPGPSPAQNVVFGTDAMVAAGINYVTDLAIAGYRPMVINMSLGGPALEDIERAAIDRAIANGVIVVAAAGNEGEAGMSFPGAYPPVISAGAVGWIGEWLPPGAQPDPALRYRMWWLKDGTPSLVPPLLAGSGDTPEPTTADILYVTGFSSRAYTGEGQELDVLAPGSWVRGPFPGDPGFSRLPWHSRSFADLITGRLSNFFYVGGTSMATPHVSAVAALLLERDPSLTQLEIEDILTSTALPVPAEGSRTILDNTVVTTVTWDTDCDGTPCDPVGAGLIQADEALDAVP